MTEGVRSLKSARSAVRRHPQVKGLTVMVNSIYNGYRYEDLWLDN